MKNISIIKAATSNGSYPLGAIYSVPRVQWTSFLKMTNSCTLNEVAYVIDNSAHIVNGVPSKIFFVVGRHQGAEKSAEIYVSIPFLLSLSVM